MNSTVPHFVKSWVATAAVLLATSGPLALADHQRTFAAKLTGFQEVPPKLTTGTGTFKVLVDPSGTFLSYQLSFLNVLSPTAAHIHFGEPGVNGGVMAILCGGGDKPACSAAGVIAGTITSADLIGPSNQGITMGDLAGAIRAIQSGDAYVNVHSTAFPEGEIRGQISARHRASTP